MPYADGYVLCVPKKNLADYFRLARTAGKVWRDHGALEYCECAADDLAVHCGLPFPRLVKLKPSETVVFSWIVYPSRGQRDRVNAKVMQDPRIRKMMGKKGMPFDVKRMSYAGFKVKVDLPGSRSKPRRTSRTGRAASS